MLPLATMDQPITRPPNLLPLDQPPNHPLNQPPVHPPNHALRRLLLPGQNARPLASTALIPSKQADWEAVKHLIEDLYLGKNVRLKDVMEVMQTIYHFRAT